MERRLILDNKDIEPMKSQTLIERIKELERFVDELCRSNRDLKMDIDKLYKTIGIICTSGILNDK